MNRKTLWLFGAAIVAASALNVRATLLVSDTFNYPNGNLVGNTPPIGETWNAQSAAGIGPIQVANNDSIIVNDSTTSAQEDDNSPFEGGFTDAAGDVLYSSFTVNVAAPTGTLASTYFAVFLASSSDFDSRVWITTPATAGDGFRIALSQTSSLSGTSVYSGDLQFGQTYTVVSSYDYTNQDGSLWLDPTSPSSPALGTTPPDFSDAITAYGFRQSAAAGNVIITVGDLQVGTSMADVVAVPEPASLGLIALSGMALLRRRRRGTNH